MSIVMCFYVTRSSVRLMILTSLMLGCFPLYAASPDIRINGGTNELRDNIRHYLTIAEETCSAPLWRLKSLVTDSENEIEKAGQALGYYKLTAASKLTQTNDCWQLQLDLVPGEQVKVAEFNLEIKGDGTKDEIFDIVKAQADIQVGSSLNHGKYENLKNRITTIAAGHGYFDGRFDDAIIKVNLNENTANIHLIYNTGVRYRIGKIRMKHHILNEEFLRQYLNIQTGDYYETDKLLELKSFYNSTNYFSLATASPDLQNLHDSVVDVDLLLEERKRRAYSIGAGVNTDTDARVLLGFEDRYVTDSGHSIKIDTSKSKVKTSAQLGYTIPLSQPTYEFLKVYMGYDEEEIETTYSEKDTLGTSYTYYQKNRWLHTYAVNIENEHSRVANEDIYTHLIIPSVTLSRTETDGSPHPLNGWSLTGRLSGSPKTFGSDVSFKQLYFRGKYIYPLAHGRLLFRSELATTSGEDVGNLPTSVRFFAGGDNSVRGYGYKSLGPTIESIDAEGKKKSDLVGGNSLFVSSLEYDYQFRPNWAVAAFFDAGNAVDDFKMEYKRGLGIGLRWISPVGPIRVDVARGIDTPAGWELHISMGPDL